MYFVILIRSNLLLYHSPYGTVRHLVENMMDVHQILTKSQSEYLDFNICFQCTPQAHMASAAGRFGTSGTSRARGTWKNSKTSQWFFSSGWMWVWCPN